MFGLTKMSLLLATSAKTFSVVQGAEITGYIVDNLCLSICEGSDGPCAPDGSNTFFTPELHTGWCKLLGGCEASGYSLMSEYPGDDGKHQVVLSFSGAEAHDAILDYVKATNGKDLSFEKKVHFPLVKVAYADDETVDGIPQVMSATITDPWDAAVYTGDDTSQAVCMNAAEADIETNNMCMRSDIKVSTNDDKEMFVIESSGCPDHGNMKGGSGGTVPNDQVYPIATVGKPEASGGSCCASCGTCSGKCDSCSSCGACSAKGCCSSCAGSKECSSCSGSKECSSCAGSSCSGSNGTCNACSGVCSSTSIPQRELNCCASTCSASKSCCGICSSYACKGNTCGACSSYACKGNACCSGDKCGVCGSCSGDKCGVCGACGACGSSKESGEETIIGDFDPMYQHYTMMIPQDPGTPGEAKTIEDGVVGLMTNGVLLDTHEQTWSYDECTGHSDTKHQYHYHLPPTCFLKSMGVAVPEDSDWWMDDEKVRLYEEMSAQWPSTGSSPVVGFARDGFPIKALYDSSGALQRSQVYDGELDECNGKTDSDGYAYYLTAEPPFVPTCLRGEIGSFSYAPSAIACPKDGITNVVAASSTEAVDTDTSAAYVRHGLISIVAAVGAVGLLF